MTFQVSFVGANKPQKHAHTSNDAPSPSPPPSGKEHSHKNKFELPPRLQKAAAAAAGSAAPPARSVSFEEPTTSSPSTPTAGLEVQKVYVWFLSWYTVEK